MMWRDENSSFAKADIKCGSLSCMTTSGFPYLVMILSRNSLANPSDDNVLVQGIALMVLESQSTITRMESKPCNGERSVMRSKDTICQL